MSGEKMIRLTYLGLGLFVAFEPIRPPRLLDVEEAAELYSHSDYLSVGESVAFEGELRELGTSLLDLADVLWKAKKGG